MLRYAIGSTINKFADNILSSPALPLNRYIPRGYKCWYDITRMFNTRNLGVIFDVGANIGQTAYSLSKYFKSASIYCFEPAMEPFLRLSNSYCDRPNVQCINKGLGATAGQYEMQISENSELNTLVSAGPRADQVKHVEMIEIETLDNFCESHRIGTMDILKMDVQGWELEVIKGAKRYLGTKKIRAIVSEVGFRHSDSDMQHFSAFNDAMESAGFHFGGLYESFRWGAKKEYVGFANALYLNPSLARH